MHQSDPEGHTLTEELLAFDYKPTLAAWDVHYVEYEETIRALLRVLDSETPAESEGSEVSGNDFSGLLRTSLTSNSNPLRQLQLD